MNTEKIKEYPITPFLEEICGTLKKSPSRFLILTAETASGKSTILPLALLDNFDGKIVMTEPRRLAVLGIANRVSQLQDENCGETTGYKIHLENKISAKTRLEVVTEAVLLRQLQADPLLEEYKVIVLDEFHERSINTDIILAFLKETMSVRDDLFVIVMSATIDTDKLQNYLGNETPVMKVPGRQFPVEIVYDSKSTMEDAILREVNDRLPKTKVPAPTISLLAFLPSIKDIRRVEALLRSNLPPTAQLLILHSSISLEEQKKVLTPRSGNADESDNSNSIRIILSSSIAETSLTVPDVTCVIDSGLSRVNRLNISTGMENLTTEVESEFSACQRAGRAGRVQSGKCIRLWSQADSRIKNMPSEIVRADITSLVLECADRGIDSMEKIDWFEKPNVSSWNSSVFLLQQLGMMDEKNHITTKGRAALTLGIHPRLAGIALETEDFDLVLKYSSYNQSNPEIQKKFINDLKNRVKRANYQKNDEVFAKKAPVLCGFPDRLAKKISELGKNPAEFQFASGRKALLFENAGRAGMWIVAPEVMAGDREGTIFDFETVEEALVNDWLPAHSQKKTECSFEKGKIVKEEKLMFGQIVLSSKKLPADNTDYVQAWCDEVRKKGTDCLPKDSKLEAFLARAEFWFQENGDSLACNGDNLPCNGDSLTEYLIQKVNDWLPPFITENKLTAECVYNALYWFLDGSKIDIEVPVNLILPNGNKCKVKYEKVSSPEDKNKLIIRPIIEIIIQRAFGCTQTPTICGMKVLMRLLSPANRPLQITDDLEGFWTGAWPEICKEMKGRYPKWDWE